MSALKGRGSGLLSLVFTVCFFTVSFASGLSFDDKTNVTDSGLLPGPVLENQSAQSHLSSQSSPDIENLTFEGTSDVSFTYDANGNLINDKGLSYVYDDANHLSEVRFASNTTLIAKYYYNAAGNRVKKVSGGVTTYYIGDYLETRVKGAQRNDTSYYFANAERVARKDPDGSKYYYHGDHLGSTHIVTNASGAVVESVAYLPYGETQSKTGSGSNYLYTDQELDPESGLYYYDARYYSPEIMRFVEPDSVIQDLYNPQNLNRYSYVLNNPIKYTDPTGHIIPLLFAALVVGGVAAEIIYAYNNPVNPSDSGDLVDIWVEGGKGMVAATVAYAAGGLSSMLGGAQAGTAGVVAEGMTSSFAGKVTENVLDQKENWFEGTPEATAVGALSSYLGDELFQTQGRLPEKVSSMLWPAGKNAQRIWAAAVLDEALSYAAGSISSQNRGSSSIRRTDQGGTQVSRSAFTPSPISNNEYSSSQVFRDTTKGLTNSANTKQKYGFNPHKYPWDSSPLKGWD